MIDDRSSNGTGEKPPFEPPQLPQSGEDIVREVERLKREPARFQCLGMSFTALVLVIVMIVVAIMLFR